MNDYNQDMKQNNEDINSEKPINNSSPESRELLKRAISEALDLQIRESEEEAAAMEMPPMSRRHKIRMNRLFRERVGISRLPFPEEDNLYERMRSRLVIKLKINGFLDRVRERRRRK